MGFIKGVILMTIGERLVLALDIRGMQQKELAEMSGLTEVTISRYITGSREPKADNIIKICKVLCISSDWLLGLKDNVKRGMKK